MILSFLKSRWFTVLALTVLVLIVATVIKRGPALSAISQEYAQVDRQISELHQEKADLEARKEYLQSSLYLERQARIKLNYKKPGEQVVYVYHKPTAVDALSLIHI